MAEDHDMPFPAKGIDAACEFSRQPEKTTPLGENVRTSEPTTLRERGAMRPGLSPYVPQQPGGGSSLIQHLEVIVDPQSASLTGSTVNPDTGVVGADDDDTDPGIPDPSTNNAFLASGDPDDRRTPEDGRTIRSTGSGVQPVRGGGEDEDADDGFALNDTHETYVGAAPRYVDVLANDTYTGTPTVTIISGPTLAGATATVEFSGPFTRIAYTPPETGGGGTDEIVYELTTSTGQTPDQATLTVTVAAEPETALCQTITRQWDDIDVEIYSDAIEMCVDGHPPPSRDFEGIVVRLGKTPMPWPTDTLPTSDDMNNWLAYLFFTEEIPTDPGEVYTTFTDTPL